jgi:hypothetical protein
MANFTNSALITSDTTVKAVSGFLQRIIVSFKGVTAGEFVTISNHATANTPALLVIPFAAANGVVQLDFGDIGLKFDTAIRVNVGATLGQVWVHAQYR